MPPFLSLGLLGLLFGYSLLQSATGIPASVPHYELSPVTSCAKPSLLLRAVILKRNAEDIDQLPPAPAPTANDHHANDGNPASNPGLSTRIQTSLFETKNKIFAGRTRQEIAQNKQWLEAHEQHSKTLLTKISANDEARRNIISKIIKENASKDPNQESIRSLTKVLEEGAHSDMAKFEKHQEDLQGLVDRARVNKNKLPAKSTGTWGSADYHAYNSLDVQTTDAQRTAGMIPKPKTVKELWGEVGADMVP